MTKDEILKFMDTLIMRLPADEQPNHVLFYKDELDALGSINSYYGPKGLIRFRDKDKFYLEQDIQSLKDRVSKLEVPRETK